MERLTIKELAPYSPYDLDVMLGSIVRELTAISLDSPFVFVTAYKGSREKQMAGIENIKPLLRPLSSLTEEIEHNGEKFVPIDELCFRDTVEAFKEFPEQKHNLTPHIRYMDVEKLFEWHFDVFGLIDRNLAIPIDGKEVENG